MYWISDSHQTPRISAPQLGQLARLITRIMTGLVMIGLFAPNLEAGQTEYAVYEIHQRLSLGNPNESNPKDYYINLGIDQGIKIGTVIEVFRRTPTYDLANEDFYRDVAYPIAHLKVIHADRGASICRLDKFLPLESTPAISPHAIMVGDLVQPFR